MRKTTQLVLAFVGLNVLGLLLLGWSMALSMATDPTLSPYWEVQAPDREVGLGGQRATTSSSAMSRCWSIATRALHWACLKKPASTRNLFG